MVNKKYSKIIFMIIAAVSVVAIVIVACMNFMRSLPLTKGRVVCVSSLSRTAHCAYYDECDIVPKHLSMGQRLLAAMAKRPDNDFLLYCDDFSDMPSGLESEVLYWQQRADDSPAHMFCTRGERGAKPIQLVFRVSHRSRRLVADFLAGDGSRCICGSSHPKTVCVSFADGDRYTPERIIEQAKASAYFDGIHVTSAEDMPLAVRQYAEAHPSGFGHYRFKPYAVSDALRNCSDGDCIVWCDSLNYIRPCRHNELGAWINCAQESELGIACFPMHYREREWTKRAVMEFFQSRAPLVNLEDVGQITVCKFVIYVSTASRAFVAEWLRLCDIDYLLDSRLCNEASYFRQPRWEQSIFSCLIKTTGGASLIMDSLCDGGDNENTVIMHNTQRTDYQRAEINKGCKSCLSQKKKK